MSNSYCLKTQRVPWEIPNSSLNNVTYVIAIKQTRHMEQALPKHWVSIWKKL